MAVNRGTNIFLSLVIGEFEDFPTGLLIIIYKQIITGVLIFVGCVICFFSLRNTGILFRFCVLFTLKYVTKHFHQFKCWLLNFLMMFSDIKVF